MSKKIQKIQIENEMIIDTEIPHSAFAMFVELKMKSYNNVTELYIPILMQKLGWKDKRTLKKNINILIDKGYIVNDINRLIMNKPIRFELKKIEGYYTQVDIHTLKKIRSVTRDKLEVIGVKEKVDVYDRALRLFYYYEKNYNINYGKAFTPYELIIEQTKIHSTYIKTINNLFSKSKLVAIVLGEWYEKEIDDGMFIPQKSCNEYIPLCNRS